MAGFDPYNRPAPGGPLGKPTLAQTTFNPRASGGAAAAGLSGAVGGGGAGGSMRDIDAAWNRVFGASTPEQLIGMRDANGGVLPTLTATPSADPGASPPPAKPTASPAAAGNMNAMMPGVFGTGHAVNGTRPVDSGYAPPVQNTQVRKPAIGVGRQRPAVDPAAGAQAAATPQVNTPLASALSVDPTALPQPDAPAAPLAQAAAAAAQPQQRAAPADTGGGIYSLLPENQRAILASLPPAQREARARAWGYKKDANGRWSKGAAPTPVDPGAGAGAGTDVGTGTGVGAGGTGTVTGAPGDTANKAPGDQNRGEPGTGNAQGWYNANGVLVPWDSVSWQDNKQVDPVTFIQNGTNWTNGFWQTVGGFDNEQANQLGQLPNPNPELLGGYTVNATTPTADYAGKIPDQGVRSIAGKYQKLVEDWLNLTQGNAAEDAQPGQLEALRSKLEAYDAAFGRYGGDLVLPWEEGFQGPGVSGNAPRGEPGYDPTVINTDIDTSISSIESIMTRLYGNRWKDMSPEEKSAALQLSLDYRNKEDALQRQQQGIDILGQNLDMVQNNPLRKKADEMALAIAGDPNAGLDFQGEQNRLAADFDAGTNQAVAAASLGAGRRLGSGAGGAMAGYTGNLVADQGNKLSRALGEMRQSQAQTRRSNELQGLSALSGILAQTGSAESGARRDIANAVMGRADTGEAAFQNAFDVQTDISAIEQALAELKASKEASRNSFYGDLAGGVLGAGAQLGAAAILA